MRKFSIFIMALGFSFNLFARESTLLDSGWRFKSGEVQRRAIELQRRRLAGGFIPHNWGWEEAHREKSGGEGSGRSVKDTDRAHG